VPWTHEMVKIGGESRFECRFCSIRWFEPFESDSADQIEEKVAHFKDLCRQICLAAERRALIYDVGLEAASPGMTRPHWTTQERSHDAYLTPWALSIVQDGRFAKQMADMAIGGGHGGHNELVTEFFREIRAERRRLELGEDMIRIEHPVYVDTMDINKKT
jgi:hypothetical protein